MTVVFTIMLQLFEQITAWKIERNNAFTIDKREKSMGQAFSSHLQDSSLPATPLTSQKNSCIILISERKRAHTDQYCVSKKNNVTRRLKNYCSPRVINDTTTFFEANSASPMIYFSTNTEIADAPASFKYILYKR